MLALLAAAILAPPLQLRIDAGHVLNTIRPDEALGAGIDGHEEGTLDLTFRPNNLAAMDSVGLRPLTYRLRTELAIEAWHWNPEGTWSDPAHHQGYFIGNPVPTQPILKCYGYRLPRRGNTTDQANDDGYSRIDDGDLQSFWKSNPYLDAHFTRIPNQQNPQWVMLDLRKPELVDEIQIDWAAPYATRYRIEYWTGRDAINLDADDEQGVWLPFRNGTVDKGTGGPESHRFAPKRARFVRICLLESSGTSLEPSLDIRDSLGFAIREVRLGRSDANSKFRDLLTHAPKNSVQSFVLTSSTDPWHRESDLDRKVEQPGFDRVAASVLPHKLPILFPVSVLYDNPETAANEIAWLQARGIPMRGIEMGEESDGQFDTPEHYAQLYAQVARKLKAIAPNVSLGGPCYQTTTTDVDTWPDAHGNRSYTNRVLRTLRREHTPLEFFSFEWYPWDDTLKDPYPNLVNGPSVLAGFLDRQVKAGITHKIPWLITEYGYSAFSGPPEVDLPGGILNADIVGTFLAHHGDAAYLYGYEPNEVIAENPGAWGNLMILETDEDGNAKWKLPTYWTAWLMTHVWTLPGHSPHRLVQVNGLPANGDLGAYAMLRPDGKTAVLLVNRNPRLAQTVSFDSANPAQLFTYGRDQFIWHPDGAKGHPARSLPPVNLKIAPHAPISLPPYSINVLVLG